jgi:hypothetical protein
VRSLAAETVAVRALLDFPILTALLAAACTAPPSASGAGSENATEDEAALRLRLHAAHEATLRLELRAHLDAAAIARGVREVRAWTDWSDWVAHGAVDTAGQLSLTLPTLDVHDRCLTVVHLVDHAGAHWCSWLDLTTAAPDGRHDAGELRLQREPDPLVVVDERGRPVAGARVLLYQQHLVEQPGVTSTRAFETQTDERGRAYLCGAAPFVAEPRVVVRHEDFAPWSGSLTPAVQLDPGGEIHGRVVVPAGVATSELAVAVWVDEASPRHLQGETVYASVMTPLALDGSYRLRNVPIGKRTIHVVDRHEVHARGDSTTAEVQSTTVRASDLAVKPDHRPHLAMHLRLVGRDGRPPLASHAHVGCGCGFEVDMNDGYVAWAANADRPFAITVPGHGTTREGLHRPGTVLRLPGGHRVALRLALDAARRMPPGSVLRATVTPVDAEPDGAPVLYLDRRWHEGAETPLGIARDAPVVVSHAGRYRIELERIRWDAANDQFAAVAIDVEPSEFEVPAAAECTLVTVTSRFVETLP